MRSAAHFRLGDDGLIACDFTSWRVMEKGIEAICRGHSRETIAASIQKLAEDLISGAVGHWLVAHQGAPTGLAGGLFANVRAEPALGRDAAGRGNLHLSGDGR